MWWFDCFAFGFFLLIVGAEKEEFQSNITEQTKGTAVTKYELLKQDDTIGHGTEAIPTENTRRHTVTAEFSRAVLFDTRSSQPNEEIQNIKAASDGTGYVVSKNVQKTLTSKLYPSVTRTHRDLKIPLRSKSEKTSTQAVIESVLSDTSEPEVHLSAVAEKAPHWFHALHDDKNRRNANSVTLTSADAGLGVPILSASHPHVIDNPAALLNDKEDKRSQGKGITNLGKNAYLSGTMQSILQNDPAEDSRRGNVVTDVCLTCLKDGKAVSTEKSAALHSMLPHASSDSEGTEGFALDLNQFTASSHNLHHQLAGEHKEIPSKEIKDRNTTRLNFPERGKLIYKQRFLPFTVNKTVNDTFLSKFQSETLLSDTETFKFDSQFVAKISSATKTHLTKEQRCNFPGETFVTKGLNLTTAEPLYIDEKPVENGKLVVFSNWNPQSKCINSSRSHKNASHNLSINLKNQDISNAPVSNMSFTAEAPHSSCKSILPKGRTYSTASHPTASTSVIEARGATASFRFLRPTASAVKNQESHFLTASDDAFISILKSQTTSELNSQTKEPILTLFPRDSTIRLASVTERDMTEKRDFQAFMNEHRIVKQSSVGPPRTMQNIAMKEQQTSVFATKKVKPVKDFASSSQHDFSDELLTSTFPKLPRTKKLTRTPSKTIQRGFDVSAECFTKYKSKLITDLQDIHNVDSKNEQVAMAVAEKEDNNVLKTESNRSREVQKTEETLKLQDEEGSTEDETLENKKEEVLGLDKAESANVEKIINSGAERNRNTDREAEKMEERAGKTSREERVTLRQDKDPRQGEVREEGDAKRKGVTKINTENFTQEVAEMQRKSLDEKGAEAGGKEQSSREDMKCNKETVKEDMTNVPLEHTTNWKEVNKEHTVENLSSCHSLIKELKATEHKGIHLSENTSRKGEITNKSFSYKVTSNHQPSHLSLRSQRPQQSVKTHPAEELYTRITMHLSTHTPEPPKQAAMSTLNTAISQKKEVVFSVSATPKSSYTSGTSTSKFRGILEPRSSPQSIATKSANVLSVTTGYQSALTRFTVNTSLDVSIIHSIADHRHKFNTTGLSARTVLHALNGSDRVEYISPSMNSARHQQMYNDSSTKPRAVAALSAVAHVSMGQSRPQGGQSAAGRSRSSSSSDATSGCSFKLSEQTSHPDSLHTPDNKQGFLQALMPPMSPTAEIDQHPARRMSPALNVRTSGGDSSPVTYGLKASEKKSLQANFDPKPTNSGSDRAEPLLPTAGERNQKEEVEIMSYMVMSDINHPDTEKYEKINESPITYRSKQHATNSQIDLYYLLSADSKEEAKTADRYQFQLEDSTQENGSGEKTVKSDQTKTTAIVKSDVLPKVTNIQTHDFLNMSTQTQDHLSSLDHSGNDSTLPAPHIHLKSDLTVHRTYTQRTVDQITPIKTNNFTSMATISNINSTNVPTGGYKPLLTSEGVPVSKKSPLAVVEYKTQSISHTKPLSMKGLLTTSTPGKLTPTVKRTKTIETQSIQQPEHENFQQATEPSQHDLPAKAAISRPIKEVEPGVRAGFLKMAHRAGRAHGQTSAVVERMRYSSFKDIKSALTTKSAVEAKHPPVESISRARKQDRAEHKEHTSLGKTSISQAIIRAVTDSVPPAGISPTEIINKTGCRTIGCAKSGGTTRTTSGAGVIDHTGEMYKVHSAFTERDHFMVENTADIKPENQNRSFLSGRATQRVINLKVELSPVTSKSEHDHTSADDSGLKKVKRTSDKAVHLEGHGASQRALPVTKTTQRGFHRETSRAQEATAGEASPSKPEAAAEKTTVKSTEQTLLTVRNTKTQLDRRAGKARIFEVQNASRSLRAHAKEETARPESGSRLLPSELEFKSELNQKRRTSPHLYLPGVTEVSDDLCGSGNYTAEMILKLGRAVEPGDAVPAGGNLRVVINLKTNNSQINLGVTSCCLSPTTQPDLTNSTCCLFSRLAAEPSGITLLPSALSASASFTISLFQMINYSVVYLHCDLSVCLRNHSGCERQCLEERSALLSRSPGTIVANLRNRISFGPMLKQVKNSTFPEEIDQSELDLVLVIVSLAVGLPLITVMLLLVWLAYRRRAMWLLRSAAPPRSCCGCPHPEGDLISP